MTGVRSAACRSSPQEARGWREQLSRHSLLPALQVVAAHDGETMVGFCYGTPARHYEPWTRVPSGHTAPVVPPDRLATSLALMELHVTPAWQRLGIGRRLAEDLCSGHPTLTDVYLTTPDGPTPARRLYASLGFHDRGLHVRVADTALAVLHAPLPLRAQEAGRRRPLREGLTFTTLTT
ncbi:GNAT family N-acetyltransferase [Kitasatospora sp. NPDC101176]|uniref:GNAT family N-acetyltransferase n=1 Tax=Kitasatospora sp. NPDC101176 TaxID=3364099 RepID=UPI0038221C3A